MVQVQLALLFAGIDDWLQFLVPAVFVIIWIVSQFMGMVGQKPARPRRQPGQPQQPGRGLADQIDAFLKQVQQAQQDQQDRARGKVRPQRAAPPQPAEMPGAPRRRPEPLAGPQQPEVVEAELIEPERVEPPPVKLRRAARQQKSPPRHGRPPRAIPVERATAEPVDLADEKMAEHMQQVFDHEVGALADTSDAIHEKDAIKKGSPTVEIPTTAQAIRDMLAEPQSVRKAVILSEILRRPEPRW